MSAATSQEFAGILLPPSHSSRAKHPKPYPGHQAFVHHYLETGNGTKSTILAGYSEKSASAAASRLLTNPEIIGAIEAAMLKHFGSKGVLLVESLSEAFREFTDALVSAAEQSPPGEAWKTIVKSYLRPELCDHPERGCPFAALAPELYSAGR